MSVLFVVIVWVIVAGVVPLFFIVMFVRGIGLALLCLLGLACGCLGIFVSLKWFGSPVLLFLVLLFGLCLVFVWFFASGNMRIQLLPMRIVEV
jgi:hypothetical protein